jgi:hypothetical protein
MFGLKKLEKRAKAMILLALTGGVGLGGYANRDHPLVQKILGIIRQEVSKRPPAPGEPGTGKAILEALIEQVDPFRKPGAYEVTIEKIRLDGQEFHAGRAVDLEVRVVKYTAEGGKGKVVWEGKAPAGRNEVAGRGPITVAFADKPFKVEWNEGDEFDVEIWDRKGFRPTKWFVFETEDDGAFPLRTKTHTLPTLADGKAVRNPGANTIALKARRVAEPPASTESVATRDRARTSTRR